VSAPPRLAAGSVVPAYRVRAHNASVHSENKIHDDVVARQYGFAGGLVPGVTVYAYMTRPVVDALGTGWVEHGAMSARFLKPFYEGEEVTVETSVDAVDAGLALSLRALNPAGDLCAVASVTLDDGPRAVPSPDAVPEASLPPERPPASESAFRERPLLGSLHEVWDAGEPTSAYLEEVADDHPAFRGPEAIAHPGYLIRHANTILARNVVLGPWIHVSSDVEHFGLVHHGDPLSTRGRVVDLFERKGHRFVVLDVLVVAGDSRAVLRARHTAIYEPRGAGAS
jgi:acyl dehydratase